MKKSDKLKVWKHRKSGMYLLLWNGSVLMDGDDGVITFYRKRDAKQHAEELMRYRYG